MIAEAQEVSIFVVHTDLYLQDLEDIRFGEFLISINEHLFGAILDYEWHGQRGACTWGTFCSFSRL